MSLRHVFTFLIGCATLLMVMGSANANYNMWGPEDGVQIRQGDHINWLNKGVAQHDDGSYAVVWSAATEQTQNIYIQIFDASGDEQLPSGGVQVTNGYWAQNDAIVMPYGDDEWIVGWRDYRVGTEKMDPGVFYMQRVHADGSIAWEESGVAVEPERWRADQMYFFPADSDNFYAVWGGFYGAYVQKFTADGVELFGTTLLVDQHLMSNALTDDDGGVLLVCEDFDSDGLMVHHVLPDGTLEWGTDGVAVVEYPGQHNPSYESTTDGMGGVFVSWCFYSDQGLSDVYGQHMDSEGVIQWEPMTVIAGGLGHQSHQMLFPADPNSMIVLWSYGENWWDETEARCQRVTSAEGAAVLEWGTDETGLSLGDATIVDTRKSLALMDDDSGAWIAWITTQDGYDYWTRLLHVNQEGAVHWNQGVVQSTAMMCGGIALLEQETELVIVARENLPYDVSVAARTFSKETGDDLEYHSIVSGFNGDTYDPVIERVDNSAYIGWQDGRAGKQGTFPYLQRVDVLTGIPQWQDHGVYLIPGINSEYDEADFWTRYVQVIGGGQGSAIVSWNMSVDSYPDDGYEAYLQKVSPDGEMLWGELGVQITRADGNWQSYISILKTISDGAGGAYMFNMLSDTDFDYSFFLQHVDAAGNLEWAGDGVELFSSDGYITLLDVVPLPDESMMVFYRRYDEEIGRRVLVNRINTDGSSVWPEPVLIQEMESPYYQLRTHKVRQVGDYFLVGMHLSDSAYQNCILRVQGVDADGNLIWPDNPMEFTSGDYATRYFTLAPAGNAQFWLGTTTGYEYTVNKYDHNQQALFDEPIPLGTSGMIFSDPHMVTDDANGFFIVWQSGEDWTDTNISYTHITADGSFAQQDYTSEGLSLTSAPHEQNQLCAIPDGEGGVLTVWNDYRGRLGALEGDDVYAMRIHETLSGVGDGSNVFQPAWTMQPAYPNPFNPSTQIRYTLTAPSNVRVDVYDVLGRHVATLVNEVKLAGSHTATWQGANAGGQSSASGTYFIRMKTSEGVKTQRVVLMK